MSKHPGTSHKAKKDMGLRPTREITEFNVGCLLWLTSSSHCSGIPIQVGYNFLSQVVFLPPPFNLTKSPLEDSKAQVFRANQMPTEYVLCSFSPFSSHSFPGKGTCSPVGGQRALPIQL